MRAGNHIIGAGVGIEGLNRWELGTTSMNPKALLMAGAVFLGTVGLKNEVPLPVVLCDGGEAIKWSGSRDGCGISCSDNSALLVSVNQRLLSLILAESLLS